MKKTIRLTALSLVLVMMVAVLASCGGPSADPDKAVKALQEEGYTAVKLDSLDDVDVKGVTAVVTGMKDVLSSNPQIIAIIYFEDSSACNDAWDEIKEDIEKDNEDYVIKKSGKMIYYGTEEAIKAAG